MAVKGTKRKARHHDATEPKQNKKQSTRTPKPSKPDEYFEPKRNLEDLWKQAFSVGTEWDLLDSVYQCKWDFSNLENAFEEGGVLHEKKVYLFGCTEPLLVHSEDESKVIYIPVVVAVVSPFPPSDKIGITSVQRETEEIIPMKQMKMDWVPYIPLENRESQVDRLKSQIFILSCTQRSSAEVFWLFQAIIKIWTRFKFKRNGTNRES